MAQETLNVIDDLGYVITGLCRADVRAYAEDTRLYANVDRDSGHIYWSKYARIFTASEIANYRQKAGTDLYADIIKSHSFQVCRVAAVEAEFDKDEQQRAQALMEKMAALFSVDEISLIKARLQHQD
jgi:hypothetical protein